MNLTVKISVGLLLLCLLLVSVWYAMQQPPAILIRDCRLPAHLSEQDRPAFEAAYQSLQNKQDLLMLVDKQHAVPPKYQPSELRNYLNVSMTDLTRKAFLIMMKEARKEKIRLQPISGFRSYKRQYELKAHAKHPDYVAFPGHSQHQLGTAIDFNTAEVNWDKKHEPVLKWLREHAGEYGFSLSFPQGQEALTGYPFEPWHYRYISKEAVFLQDTFFQGSQQAMLEFLSRCLWPEQEQTLRKNSQKILRKEAKLSKSN